MPWSEKDQKAWDILDTKRTEHQRQEVNKDAALKLRGLADQIEEGFGPEGWGISVEPLNRDVGQSIPYHWGTMITIVVPRG